MHHSFRGWALEFLVSLVWSQVCLSVFRVCRWLFSGCSKLVQTDMSLLLIHPSRGGRCCISLSCTTSHHPSKRRSPCCTRTHTHSTSRWGRHALIETRLPLRLPTFSSSSSKPDLK